jgi:beta-galactosidase
MYAPEKANYPKRLLLGTETYHDTRHWLAVKDNDYVIGEFVWVAFDYLGEDGVWPKRGWDAGLLDMAGTPYPEYYLRKSYWSAEPVVHIAIEAGGTRQSEWHPRKAVSHWNHFFRGDYLLPVYIYSNCDEVELRINDSVVGKKAVDKNLYYAKWEIPFREGKIRAIGYRNNKKVTEHLLQTADKASGFKISPNKKSLIAGTDDIIQVEVSVVDKNDVVVPDASHEVSVEVSGAARLIGIDNGSQRDTTAYKTNKRKAFQGKLLLTIQATASQGPVKIALQAPGLKNAVYSVDAVAPAERRRRDK